MRWGIVACLLGVGCAASGSRAEQQPIENVAPPSQDRRDDEAPTDAAGDEPTASPPEAAPSTGWWCHGADCSREKRACLKRGSPCYHSAAQWCFPLELHRRGKVIVGQNCFLTPDRCDGTLENFEDLIANEGYDTKFGWRIGGDCVETP